MAVIKCKMCGGELVLTEGQYIAECEYCGSRQTVPSADNEKKLNLFSSAHKLRAACEFDRAIGVYDQIRAEFPDEAEAYWGLVLCKYGIEYVDDPGTSKKVPTCHRSSFMSILEDEDFERALENAEPEARRLYLEEGRRLEQIRKDILTVSSKEAPYDVFICYKETDASGDRTLDSQLAQQIYMALTDRGYRVFFARVTLKSALGTQYEPVIFAALNSAKVMLAVGTCYEHFNAVWVKNEWSRFLKLCAQSKDKHLIPCYRDIDAYDMPREFRPLQAVDLGQMGAVQDIVLNMEKYIPLRDTVTVERVVSGGDSRLSSILERGHMALEDGDWSRADSFFEDVLNNDARNAQAYLGKTLAMERCRTLEAFIRKRKELTQTARAESGKLEPDRAHIGQMAEKYCIPGYVTKGELRALYETDTSYSSEVAERERQYSREEKYWAEHKQLSRAERFAAGEVAATLAREKAALFEALDLRVKEARAAEAAARDAVRKRYEEHLRQADLQAQALHEEGAARRDRNYESLAKQAEMAQDIRKLQDIAQRLEDLKGYRESAALVEHCRRRIAEEQEKLRAKEERRRLQWEQELWERQAKRKRQTVASAAVAAAALALFLTVVTVVIPARHYARGQDLMEAGEYLAAAKAFERAGSFRDSEEMTEQCRQARYQQALELKAAGQYTAAIEAFQSIRTFSDSQEQILLCEEAIEDERKAQIYAEALEELEKGYYDTAIELFLTIEDYGDSAEQIARAEQAKSDAASELVYQEAERLLQAGEDKKAALAFGSIPDYKDAFERSLALRDPYFRDTVASCSWFAVGIRNDGTVVGTASALGSGPALLEEIKTWTDVIDIRNNNGDLVALRSDGTVYVAGGAFPEAAKWEHIVQIAMDYELLIGLKADGTLVATGERVVSSGSKATDVYEIHICDGDLYCVFSDGSTGADFGGNSISWDNVRAVDRLKLYDDGTVSESVTIYKNTYSLKGWKDIVSIASYNHFAVGVKADGTVLKVGDLGCNIWGWRNIARIWVPDSPYTVDNLIALTKDGKVLLSKEKETLFNYDVSVLTDIRVPVF